MTFRKFVRVLVLLFTYFLLIVGLIFGIIIITGGFAAISIVLDIFLPQFTIMAFLYMIAMVIILRLKWGQRKWFAFTLILGFLTFGLNILPLFGVNQSIQSAESQFTAIFGSNWADQIDANLKIKFRTSPFELWSYFNGFSPAPCNVTRNVEYRLVNGNDSLRFDVYSPPEGNGPFPVIITIHGGGWTSGNKGTGNMFQMSRYLANQGYIVFDLIYGLAHSALSDLLEMQSFIGRDYVKYNNSYTIPQMVENIGNFTYYLAAHATEYKANLSTVIVMGRSAGAHLAATVGLGYKNSPFSYVFNQSITIRGIVLFYPPTNLTKMLENSVLISNPYQGIFDIRDLFNDLLENNISKYAEYSPISYVDTNSPPILTLHGTQDRLVPFTESVNLQLKMNSVGRPCILIKMPFMGHAFDIIPGNPYSQIATYYIERFLALTTTQIV